MRGPCATTNGATEIYNVQSEVSSKEPQCSFKKISTPKKRQSREPSEQPPIFGAKVAPPPTSSSDSTSTLTFKSDSGRSSYQRQKQQPQAQKTHCRQRIYLASGSAVPCERKAPFSDSRRRCSAPQKTNVEVNTSLGKIKRATQTPISNQINVVEKNSEGQADESCPPVRPRQLRERVCNLDQKAPLNGRKSGWKIERGGTAYTSPGQESKPCPASKETQLPSRMAQLQRRKNRRGIKAEALCYPKDYNDSTDVGDSVWDEATETCSVSDLVAVFEAKLAYQDTFNVFILESKGTIPQGRSPLPATPLVTATTSTSGAETHIHTPESQTVGDMAARTQPTCARRYRVQRTEQSLASTNYLSPALRYMQRASALSCNLISPLQFEPSRLSSPREDCKPISLVRRKLDQSKMTYSEKLEVTPFLPLLTVSALSTPPPPPASTAAGKQIDEEYRSEHALTPDTLQRIFRSTREFYYKYTPSPAQLTKSLGTSDIEHQIEPSRLSKNTPSGEEPISILPQNATHPEPDGKLEAVTANGDHELAHKDHGGLIDPTNRTNSSNRDVQSEDLDIDRDLTLLPPALTFQTSVH
ncbi:unnamed protein product [Dibothriocephalus latus]|uniref:Uncharacterized protein n=1 Tax=Dibothriocephalus latus TaxID=60516 RepID=A0A3P6UV26_DIBLA|nr:unnamed protein product [Dibothriocephalus latus]